MTKYYYDCPLEAAYMAKNFGMRFIAPLNAKFDWKSPDSYMSRNREWILINGKLYIHPDSVAMLEPRDDDLCEVVDDDMFCVDCGGVYGYGCDIIERQNKFKKIIQRDGKPFFWPKMEI